MSELVKTVSMRKTGQTFKAASSRHSVSAVHAMLWDEMPLSPRTGVNIQVVGSEGIGKSWFVYKFATHETPKRYHADCLPRFTSEVELATDKAGEYPQTVAFSLMDSKTKSTDLSQHTNVFLLCYSAIDRQSFEDLSLKWLKLLSSFAPPAKIVLVALKQDLAHKPENASNLVSEQQVNELAQRIKAAGNLKCSSLIESGEEGSVDEVMHQAIALCVEARRRAAQKKSCCLLL